MTYWEPIATPNSHLEPPDPIEEICETCYRDADYCACGSCDACDALGPTEETRSGDEDLWLCETCRQETDA